MGISVFSPPFFLEFSGLEIPADNMPAVGVPSSTFNFPIKPLDSSNGRSAFCPHPKPQDAGLPPDRQAHDDSEAEEQNGTADRRIFRALRIHFIK